MPWLRTMYASLSAEMPSREQFAAASRGWLTGTLETVFPDLLDGLRSRPVVRKVPRPMDDMDLPWGQPGHVLGMISVYRKHPAFNPRDTVYSARAWQRMLETLDEYPWAVTVTIWELGSNGFPRHEGFAVLRVERDAYEPDWATFTFSADAADTGWPDSPAVQDRWAEFVCDQAGKIGACAGQMTDDLGGSLWSLQRATFMKNFRLDVSDSRSVLRGYTWVTVVAGELAARLGGAGALAASGAFCQIRELADGSVFLRATPTINEFTGDRVRRVFEALAPVLITGKAEVPSNESPSGS